MGISRDKAHKRRATGGRHKRIRMKRKFEMGRQPANTKIGEKNITRIRVRGGNFKFRALRLDHGNYSWAGESVTRKTRVLKVVYNSTNNELVRTNTLVKGSIILIDSTPFKAWYLQYYNIDLSNKKEIAAAVDKKAQVKDVKEEKGKKGAAEKQPVPKKEGEKAKKEEKPSAKKTAETKTEEKSEKSKKPAEKKPEEKPEKAKKTEKKSEKKTRRKKIRSKTQKIGNRKKNPQRSFHLSKSPKNGKRETESDDGRR
jgi:small subunit ribosomal protein S8e